MNFSRLLRVLSRLTGIGVTPLTTRKDWPETKFMAATSARLRMSSDKMCDELKRLEETLK